MRLRDFAGVLQQLLLAAPVRLWAVILAGLPLTALDAWCVWILWRGGWPIEVVLQRLNIIGAIAGAHVVLVGIVVISLAAVKIEAETKLGKLSIGGDADGDGHP